MVVVFKMCIFVDILNSNCGPSLFVHLKLCKIVFSRIACICEWFWQFFLFELCFCLFEIAYIWAVLTMDICFYMYIVCLLIWTCILYVYFIEIMYIHEWLYECLFMNICMEFEILIMCLLYWIMNLSVYV